MFVALSVVASLVGGKLVVSFEVVFVVLLLNEGHQMRIENYSAKTKHIILLLTPVVPTAAFRNQLLF